MDPNVQVAAIGVFATFITTCGLVAVAMINNRKERAKAAGAGVEAGLDDRSVFGILFSLMAENDRKEDVIQKLRKENADLKAENRMLRKGASANKEGTSS